MTAGTDIWVIKTVHKECPYQTEWDPSEYYTDLHVYDIKEQINTYYNKPFNFHLVTNDTTIAMPGIKIHDCTHWNLWGWWNKMGLFSEELSGDGLNIYIDLDTVIQRDFTSLGDFVPYDKLSMLYCFWKPIDWESQAFKVSNFDPDFEFATLINSSIMAWHGKGWDWIWKQFMEDPENYTFKFRGNDEYMSHWHKDLINTFPRGWAYSYFFGAEEGSEFFPKDKESFVKRHDYVFRLLNGQGKKFRDEEEYLTKPTDDVIRKSDEKVIKTHEKIVTRRVEYY